MGLQSRSDSALQTRKLICLIGLVVFMMTALMIVWPVESRRRQMSVCVVCVCMCVCVCVCVCVTCKNKKISKGIEQGRCTCNDDSLCPRCSLASYPVRCTRNTFRNTFLIY
jgi:hypothetical protein